MATEFKTLHIRIHKHYYEKLIAKKGYELWPVFLVKEILGEEMDKDKYIKTR